jgi:hypothetical protein
MSGLWKNQPETPEGKYLVQRRDGSVPEWPYFVIAASDIAAPAALLAYAQAAEAAGMDPVYVAEVCDLAAEFDNWRNTHVPGNPDAPRHRTDDPDTIEKMRLGHGA